MSQDASSSPALSALSPSENLILKELVFPSVTLREGKLVVTPGSGLRVKNRIFRSSISGRFDNDNGTGTETRIRWEEKFARGGVGAIISSFVPVQLNGRILINYATIHHNDTIPFWRELVERVHKFECKYIVQLSHSGRQRDVPGILNVSDIARSATSKTDSFHGLLSQRMSDEELQEMIDSFAEGAWRAREAGADGVELHASHGYLFTQFLSSAINNYPPDHKYGGPIEKRAQFLVDVITAIRKRVGWDFHVQAKINILDRNRAFWPLEREDGNGVEENLKVFALAENAGLNGLHVSAGSTFPHPLVPPGGFPTDELAGTYGGMASSGVRSFTNLTLFHFPALRPIFGWIWNRTKSEFPVEGVTAQLSHAVREESLARAKLRGVPEGYLPVLNTGGYQDGKLIRQVIEQGDCDGVSIARPLIANNDLVNSYFAKGKDLPDKPCSFCNRCLVNAIANPLGCYDQRRFTSRKEMLEAVESVFALQIPIPGVVSELTITGEQRTRFRDGELVDRIYATPVELALRKKHAAILLVVLAVVAVLVLLFVFALAAWAGRDRPVTAAHVIGRVERNFSPFNTMELPHL